MGDIQTGDLISLLSFLETRLKIMTHSLQHARLEALMAVRMMTLFWF
jgi:hypothetical protein